MAKIALKKGEDTKIIDESSSLKTALLDAGWSVEGGKSQATNTDLAGLRKRASELGLKLHPATGAKKLAEAVAKAEAESE